MLKQPLICIALVPILEGCSLELPRGISTPSPSIPFFTAAGSGRCCRYKGNWTREEIQSGGDKFCITLKKHMLRHDGDSEADMLFKRRAAEIAAELGYDYLIMKHNEGIESAALGPQRVAHGLIQCYQGAATAK